MAVHELFPTPETLHGSFAPTMPPILTIVPGDRIVARTPDAGWGLLDQLDPYAVPAKFEVPAERRDGHALLGPIFVEGAEPGDAVEILLDTVVPGTWGWTAAGGWPSEFNERLGLVGRDHYRMGWRIEGDQGIDANGRCVSLSPFLGWIGLMPAGSGPHSTTPPRRVGGNLDCRELVAGTRLFLPVEVAGGLLSFGDGHAVQGDGEVAGPALECPMERVGLTILLHKSKAPNLPYAETPAGWVNLGFGERLDDAMYAALEAMVDRIANALAISRQEALTIASMKVSLRITQIVNEIKGVHALLPNGALAELGLSKHATI